MRSVRRLARLFALAMCTSLAVLAVACSRVVGWFAAELGDRLERKTASKWARCMSWILGVRIKCKGLPPEGRYVLVSNHLSYVDILTIMSVVDARFLSKAEVAHWPMIGPVARFAGTLFVDRTRRTDLPRVLTEIESVLDGGRGVVFFPEGTSSPGFEVLPFKASLFEVAARGRFEIACAAVHYETPEHETPAEWSVCWWGDMGFASHLWPMLGLSRIEAEVHFSEARLVNEDRKQLAQAARSEVQRLFRRVCEEDPSELTSAS